MKKRKIRYDRILLPILILGRGQVPHRAGAEAAHGGCRQQRQRPEG